MLDTSSTVRARRVVKTAELVFGHKRSSAWDKKLFSQRKNSYPNGECQSCNSRSRSLIPHCKTSVSHSSHPARGSGAQRTCKP